MQAQHTAHSADTLNCHGTHVRYSRSHLKLHSQIEASDTICLLFHLSFHFIHFWARIQFNMRCSCSCCFCYCFCFRSMFRICCVFVCVCMCFFSFRFISFILVLCIGAAQYVVIFYLYRLLQLAFSVTLPSSIQH